MKTEFFHALDVRRDDKRVNELPTTTICDGYHITDAPTFQQIFSFYQQLNQENPDLRYLLILDDRDQAGYTAMHCNDFDDTDGYDLSNLPDDVFEINEETGEKEHIGYLTCADEWFIRLGNFQTALNNEFVELTETALLENENFTALEWDWENWQIFLNLLKDPSQAVRFHDDNYLFVATAPHSWEMVAVMPNGYWSGDLSPTENALFSAVMAKNFGYDLFGIGSNLLGFVRTSTHSPKQAQALADWLLDNFGADNACDDDGEVVEQSREKIRQELVPLLQEKPYLFISYSENAFELFEL